MSFGSDARCEGLTSPTLQAVACGQLYVTLKDIVSGICTVQEEGFLTDWNDFFYNDTKLGVPMKWASIMNAYKHRQNNIL